MRIPTYLCPSEVNDTLRVDSAGNPYIYPHTYGFNFGTWLVWDPATNVRAATASCTSNSTLRQGSILDGTSNTLCPAEVKAFTSYSATRPTRVRPRPASATAFAGMTGQLKLGPNLNDNTGHTEWCDGRVHHSGFTTVFTPNTRVPYTSGGKEYDIDFNSRQEGQSATQVTYAAITARSYHSGHGERRDDGRQRPRGRRHDRAVHLARTGNPRRRGTGGELLVPFMSFSNASPWDLPPSTVSVRRESVRSSSPALPLERRHRNRGLRRTGSKLAVTVGRSAILRVRTLPANF